MKTTKVLGTVAMCAIITLTAAFIGCDNGSKGGSATGDANATASKTGGDKDTSGKAAAGKTSGDWTVVDFKIGQVEAITFGNGKFVTGGKYWQIAYSWQIRQ